MTKKLSELKKPETNPDEGTLVEAGFTNTGKTKFVVLVRAFSDNLFDRSVLQCDASNFEGEREVTQEHVMRAAHDIYGRHDVRQTTLFISLQILEYIACALVGVGASNLKETWGIVLFGFSLFITIVSFVYRIVVVKH